MKRTKMPAVIIMAVLLIASICCIDGAAVQAASKSVKVGKGKYTITNKKKKTVRYDGVSKKSITAVSIPATVKIKKKTYQVTAIKANALKGNKKINALTIDKNVKTIGKNAFYGCKNLKSITIKTTKLTTKTVGSKAFGKLNAKLVVKVPKKKLSAYKKLLKARGVTGKKQVITDGDTSGNSKDNPANPADKDDNNSNDNNNDNSNDNNDNVVADGTVTMPKITKRVNESSSADEGIFEITAEIPEIAPDVAATGEWVENTVTAKYCTCGYGPGSDQTIQAHIEAQQKLGKTEAKLHTGWMTKDQHYKLKNDSSVSATMQSKTWTVTKEAEYYDYKLEIIDTIPNGMNYNNVTLSVISKETGEETVINPSKYAVEFTTATRELKITVDNIHAEPYKLSDGGTLVARYTSSGTFNSTGSVYVQCTKTKEDKERPGRIIVVGSGNTDSTNANISTLTLRNPGTGNYQVYQMFTGEIMADGRNMNNHKYGQNYAGKTVGAAINSSDLNGIKNCSYSDKLGGNISGSKVATLSSAVSSAELAVGYYIIKMPDGSYSPIIDVSTPADYNAGNTGIRDIDVITMPGITKEIVKDTVNSAMAVKFEMTADIPEIVPDEMEKGEWKEKIIEGAFCICGEGPMSSEMLGSHILEIKNKYGAAEALQHNTYNRNGTTITLYEWNKIEDMIYSPYTLTFHDTLPAGLDLNEEGDDITVSIVNTTHKQRFTIGKSDYKTKISSDGKEITVTINNICDDIYQMMDGGKIIVSYHAYVDYDKLETKSVSKAYLECENDMGHGVTVKDDATLIACGIDFDVVDADGEPLNGATFTLYSRGRGTIDNEAVAVVKGNESNNFHFTVLPAGNYMLVETEPPLGCKKISTYYFTVDETDDGNTIQSLKAVQVDQNGEEVEEDKKTLEWTTDLASGTLKTTIVNEIDPTKTKTITALVQHSYGGTINENCNVELKATVHVSKDSAEIEENKIGTINEKGYKFDCITVNGEKVEEEPTEFHQDDVIVYHYVIDDTATKSIRATIQYYKDGDFASSALYEQTVQALADEMSTAGIMVKPEEFSKYKLDKIVVDGKEVSGLPETIKANATVSFYYVIDENVKETLYATVKYVVKSDGAEEVRDTLAFSKEVSAGVGYLKGSDIPEHKGGYEGYAVSSYKVGYSTYTKAQWANAVIPSGSEVTVYYEPNHTLTVDWTATVQYKCGDEVKDTLTLREQGLYWDIYYGLLYEDDDLLKESQLYRKNIPVKTYAGYQLSGITLNGAVVSELPEMLKDGDVVVFNYTAI